MEDGGGVVKAEELGAIRIRRYFEKSKMGTTERPKFHAHREGVW